MAALTQDRNTASRIGDEVVHPLAAGASIYAGSIVVLNTTGYAQPATTATGLIAVGRAEQAVDNSAGTDGDKQILVRKGVFSWANDGSINRSHIGKTVYLVDDQTVAATDGTGTRSPAGTCIDIDSDGVWVKI